MSLPQLLSPGPRATQEVSCACEPLRPCRGVGGSRRGVTGGSCPPDGGDPLLGRVQGVPVVGRSVSGGLHPELHHFTWRLQPYLPRLLPSAAETGIPRYAISLCLRDWSLITGGGRVGGLQNGKGGGHVKFYPYEKRGGGGGKSFLGSFYEVA